MWKKRAVVLGAVLAAGCAVMLAYLASRPVVRLGMTEAEVESVLGPPATTEETPFDPVGEG
jgi:hypothetical protein